VVLVATYLPAPLSSTDLAFNAILVVEAYR